MFDRLFSYFQYVLPQHRLTTFAGALANSKTVWLKNWLIQRFIKVYHIDLTDALIEDPMAYESFNQFFIRKLKTDCRPIAAESNAIASPADGFIAQIGTIHQKQLLQAKNFYFDLDTLLGGDTQLAACFDSGAFATIYLAPHNYHRVHMPLTGQLEKTIYVPGRLFSVNRMTSQWIPQLYSRNERLITVFNTEAGPMAVILVGAMIVGNIQTTWRKHPYQADQINIESYSCSLKKGDELGHFKLGSTVILLFGKNKAQWLPSMQANSMIKMGELLGHTKK